MMTKKSFKTKTSGQGFTIVELLVVMAVILILAGLLVSGGTAARQRARVFSTQSMIASLETALAMYHTDFGAYPPSGNSALVSNLATNVASDPAWKGPYMSFKERDLSGTIPGATVIDPWGNAYLYTVSGTPQTYRIWSCGPDGADDNGADDDISSEG